MNSTVHINLNIDNIGKTLKRVICNHHKTLSEIISCVFDFNRREFLIEYRKDDNRAHKSGHSYTDIKKYISNIDDYIYSKEIVISNEKEFYSFNTLQNKNIVVIKYKYHPKNTFGEEKPIMSLKPGSFYIAEKIGDKYKLLTITKFERASSGYIHVTKDHRMDEYSITSWRFLRSEGMFPGFNNNKNYLNIKNGKFLPDIYQSITLDKEELKNKEFVIDKLMYFCNTDNKIINKLEGKEPIKVSGILDHVKNLNETIHFLNNSAHSGQRVHYIDIETSNPKSLWPEKLFDDLINKRKSEKIIKNSLYGLMSGNPCNEIPLGVSFDLVPPTPMGPPQEDMKYWWLKDQFEYDKHADLNEDRFLLNHRVPF